MPDVTTLLSHSFFGICRPTATAPALLTDGLIVREDTLQNQPGVLELTQINVNSGVATKIFEHVFELRVPYNIALACRLRAKYRWVVNGEAPGAAPADCTGRWGLMVTRRNVAGAAVALTSPPTEVYGSTQNLSLGTLGLQYEDDNLAIDIPANAIAAGETLRLTLGFYIVQPIAGLTLDIGLRCNPAVPADSLVFEWDV